MTFSKLFSALALLLCCATSAFGQNARVTHTITRQTHAPATLGRDLWFTMVKNYDDQAGKYYNLYVTSPQQTNIYVNCANQATKVLPVQPYSIASFNIPLGWEIKTSSILDHKAIHIWSNDGDVCAYLMSHNPYTSDGMYILPSIAWGDTNVVAAYGALYEGFGTYQYDFPSEFCVVSNQDNTVCTITPSTDLRIESSPHACKTCIAHPKGVPFTEVLNRGDAIQYLCLEAQDAENYDVTGTVVTANHPVGIVAGSMCPNIPMGYPYCDHVCEMIPPVRLWGKTYISAPFYPANPGKQWSSFLVIGTKANQVIFRADPTLAKSQYCILSTKFSSYLRPDIDQASIWTSDAPFLLVQYINSSTYPDNTTAQGDPAEVVVPAVEQWPTFVVTQAPISIGNQSPYKNYVNILVHNGAIKSTKYDDQGIANYTHLPVDNDYSVYRVSGSKAGAHMVTSDSGVGVYTYGYGYDESYAWSAPMSTGTFMSPDTSAPRVTATGQCFAAHVSLLDSGVNQSKLAFIRLDTIYNMAYNRDDPNWAEGPGRTSSYYDMYVLDSSKPAFLGISVFDAAGNRTTIRSSYAPQMAVIRPPAQDFGIGNLGGRPVYAYDTIINIGTVPFSFTDLRLLNAGDGVGKSGFTVDSAVKSPLSVGETRIIKLAFIPQTGATSFDTIVFGDACVQQKVIVYGSGGGGDFRITDYDFGIVPILDASNTAGNNHKSDPAARSTQPGTHIVNLSKLLAIVIDSIWTDDPHFVMDPTLTLPLNIPAGGDLAIECIFTPTSSGKVRAPWHAHSTSIDQNGASLGTRNAILTGAAATFGQQFFRDTLVVETCPTGNDSVHILDTLLATGALGADIVNITHSAANDPRWTGFEVFTQNGSIADFKRNPEHISTDEFLVVVENFHPPVGVTKAYYDTITATTATGEVLHVHTTIQTVFHGTIVTPKTVRFPKVPYKDPAPPAQSLYVINSADTDLNVGSIWTPGPGSKYDAAYKIASITPPLPATLRPGQSVRVDITFDPSFSPDSDQTSQIEVYTDACNSPESVTLLSQSNAAGVAAVDESPNIRVESADGGRLLRASLPSSWSGPAHLDLDNLLGVHVLSALGIETTGGATQFDVHGLASGVYFYRLTCGSNVGSGKVVIQK